MDNFCPQKLAIVFVIFSYMIKATRQRQVVKTRYGYLLDTTVERR